jgi:hypothetical protein
MMPIFEITGPDGSLYEVDGPNMEGALTALQRGLGQAKPATFNDRFAGEPGGERKAMQAPLIEAAEAQGRPTQARSALLGLGQGVAANWLDEASGGINAAIDYATGQAPGGIGAAYEKRRDEARAQLEEAERANPYTFLGSQVAGGIATAPVLPVKGPIAAGALYGAIGGAGVGEGAAGTAAGAGLGAAGGAAIGAAAPHVINAIGAGAKAVGRAVASPVRKTIAPSAEAQALVSRGLQRDARAGNTLDDETIDAAMAAGQPVRLMDVGGEATRSLARAAANTSPEARQTIQDVASDRFESQGSRIVDFVRSLSSGGANATRTREDLLAQAAKENAVNYRVAEARGRGAIWDETLEQLAQAPVVQGAIREATRRGANRAAGEGREAITNPFVVDEAGARLINPDLPPNLRFWDQVQRDLRDDVDKLLRTGAKSEARDVENIRRQLNAHLDEMVPEFKAARAGAAAAFGEDNALKVGENLFTNKMPLPEIRRNVAKMKPAERELLAEGYASAAVDRMKNTGERRNAVNALFRNPADREKAEIALGKGRAGELEAFLRRENMMDAIRGAMGNSTTARQLIELGAWNIGGVSSYMSGDPKALSIGVIVSALTRGNSALNRRVAKRVAELLVSDNPALLRKATNTIARNARVARAVRDAEDTIIRAASPAATSTAPQQGPLQFDMNRPR